MPDVYFGESATNEELITIIDGWLKESRKYHDWILIQQNKCVQYYHGNQTNLGDVAVYDSDVVYNRIFEGTETLVPIVTGSAQQFLCIPGEEDERSVLRAHKLQKVLTRKYEDLEVQRHLENATRDIILKRYGVIKWFWDIELDDVNVKTVDPRLILIPKLKVDANDVPYVMEIQNYTREEIKNYFPDVDPDELIKGPIQTSTNQLTTATDDNDIYQIFEVWTPEYVAWKQDGKILKRMPNPYWDFEGIEEEKTVTRQNGKVITKKYRRFFNHLDKPTIPYVFFNPFTTGDAPVAEISIAEASLPLQDDINEQKRQIVNNLKKLGNGQVYVDAEAIPEERLDEITSEPGLVIQGKNLASENRIRREPGVPLPQAHFANLQATLSAFDNIFGTHGAIRGSSSSPTLGGQILDRNQDLSRIEQITRCLNRGVNRLADGITQMMKMYYDEEHVIKILGRDGSIEFVRFTKNDIDDDVVINVKSGVPVNFDAVARANQAVQLWQLGAIDPETLFERLEFSNPQESAQKLAAWKSGNLLLESQLRQNEAALKAKAKAPTGAERDVETPNDVIGRAREALNGGGAAPLTNTPNGGQEAAVA